jgi:hypothetical protein
MRRPGIAPFGAGVFRLQVQGGIMTTAYERLIDALHGNVVKDNGHKATARCPAHNDNSPSLAVTAIDGSVLVYCHAGCQTEDVLAALNMQKCDLYDTRRGAEYPYPDNRRVHRTPKKDFYQKGNTQGRALFHSDRIGDVQTVYVPEGEKDVLAIEAAGGVAVCSAMGAGKADRFDWTPLDGKNVNIIADKDKPGRKHARDIAELLHGIAASVRIVEAAVGKDAADHIAAGKGLGEFVEPEPEPRVNGAELLDDIREFLARFVVYPTPHALVAHVLWIMHAWLMDCWESTPRMAFLSPEPGSGKSRALEVTEPLVPRSVHAVNTTSAYLFRKVDDPDGKPTILYDEIDTVFGPKAKENEDIRGMLNAGHRKGAVAGRCVTRGKVIETQELDAYCAVMLAGLDDLPDTLMSRAIVVRMQRRAPSEHVEPWRPRVNEPEAHALRARITTWAESVKRDAADMWPEMPPGVEDRQADKWEALITVADLAGGHWSDTARVAAVTDVTDSKAGTPSMGVLLLRDIKAVFEKHQVDRIFTETVLTDLKGMEESPWAVIRRGEPLNARGLAQRLGKYGITPDLQRIGEETGRGYTRSQFTDAWSRYLSTESVTSVTSDTDDGTAHGYASTESVTSATSDTDDEPDDLFGDPSPNGQRCGCGNRLIGSTAIWAGTCKPCRDREEAA